MSRDHRIKEFERLESLMNNTILKNYNISNKALIKNLDEIKTQIKKSVKKIVVKNENVIQTIETIEKPLVLVFSSAKNAGGGVLRGSKAQEEDISLHTTWYFQVKNNDDYYKEDYSSLLYSEKALYVKEALFLKNNYNVFNNPKPISLIGVAAPNLSGMINHPENKLSEEDVYKCLGKRIEAILSIAECEGHLDLVLGAWGCGVFGLDPKKVAKIFREKIKLGYYSGIITFSILDNEMFNIFYNEFK